MSLILSLGALNTAACFGHSGGGALAVEVFCIITKCIAVLKKNCIGAQHRFVIVGAMRANYHAVDSMHPVSSPEGLTGLTIRGAMAALHCQSRLQSFHCIMLVLSFSAQDSAIFCSLVGLGSLVDLCSSVSPDLRCLMTQTLTCEPTGK